MSTGTHSSTGHSRPLYSRGRLIFCLALIAALWGLNRFETSCRALSQGTVPATVSIARTSTGTPGDAELDQAVRTAVAQAGGLASIISPSDKVLIQPNMVNTHAVSGSGTVTDIRVVRTIVNMVKELGVPTQNICIAEGCAAWRTSYNNEKYEEQADWGIVWGPRDYTRKAFHDVGFDVNCDMVDDATGVKLMDLNDCGRTFPDYPIYPNVTDPNYTDPTLHKVVLGSKGLIRTAYYFRKEFFDYTKLIRVPVLKNHNCAGLTGAVKLALGSAPADVYHMYNSQCYKWDLAHGPSDTSLEQTINAKGLVDLNLCRKPDFVVVDGLRGVTNGPVDSPVGYANLPIRSILAGTDPIAVDTITALICGYDYLSIGTIIYGADAGLGTCDPALITVVGPSVHSIRHENIGGIDRIDFPAWGMARNIDRLSPVLPDITLPDGTHVYGACDVAPVNAYDDGSAGLCKAELYCDGALVGKSIGPLYSVRFDGSAVSEGPHQLVYKLYDRALNEAVITRTVDVRHSARLKDVLSEPDGTPVSFDNLVVSGRTPQFGNVFFAQTADRSTGVRCLWSGTGSLTLVPGDVVSMSASLMTVDGQRGLLVNGAVVMTKSDPPAPIGMRNGSIGGSALGPQVPGVYEGVGLYNLGLLIRTWGKVTAMGSDYFYIDDGSKLQDGSGNTGIRVVCGTQSKPEADELVAVTGLSITAQVNGHYVRAIAPRDSGDCRYLGGSAVEMPTMLPPTNVTHSEIEWRWTAVQGATSYRLEGVNNETIAEVSGTRFEETGLTAGTSYTRHVHAVIGFDSSLGSVAATQETAPPPGTELIVNGNFEDGFRNGVAEGWTAWSAPGSYALVYSDDGTYRYSGYHSQRWGRITGEPIEGGVYQVVKTIPGRKYVLSVQMRYDSTDGYAWCELGYDPTGQTANGSAPTVRYKRPGDYGVQKWQTQTLTFTASSAATTAFLRFGHDQNVTGEQYAWMDCVSMVESTDPVVNLAANGDFESGFQASGVAVGWSPWASTGSMTFSDSPESHYGGHAQRMESSNGLAVDGGVVKQFATTPGDTYVIRAHLIHDCSDPSAVLQIGVDQTGQTSNGMAATVKYVDVTADARVGWVKNYVEVPATGTAMSVFVRFAHPSLSGGSAGARIDDVYAVRGPVISNAIKNSDFEKVYISNIPEYWGSWKSSWSNVFTYSASTANYISGKLAEKFVSSGSTKCNGGVRQLITGLQPNHTYLFTGWTRRWTSATNPRVYVGFDPTGQTTNGDAATIQWTDVTGPQTTYQYFAVPVTTTTSTNASVWFRIWQIDEAGTGPTELLVDDVRLGS